MGLGITNHLICDLLKIFDKTGVCFPKGKILKDVLHLFHCQNAMVCFPKMIALLKKVGNKV